jgi:hypothetical protein
MTGGGENAEPGHSLASFLGKKGLDFLAGFMLKTAENDGRGISGLCYYKLLIFKADMGGKESAPGGI